MIPIFRRLRVFDYLIFASIITVSLWAGFFLYTGKNHIQRLVIETPSGKWIYPLTEPRTVVVSGAIGNTTIRIEHNTAFISDSPCPNKSVLFRKSKKICFNLLDSFTEILYSYRVS